jgi:glycerophosphoryl diester phosphodiesterase
MAPPLLSKKFPSQCVIWAHRGASADAPENTLAAFSQAERQGADGIELDVHLSRDGVPVVIHDERVERTTNGRGAVADLRVRELRSLDAGSWFAPGFAKERIPLLSEVLEWAGDRIRLNLELKTLRAGEATLALLEMHQQCQVLISSFNHRLLRTLRDREPSLELGFLCESRFWRLAMWRAAHSGAHSFHPREDLMSASLVARAQRSGLAVYPWTVDDVARTRKLLHLGVDGVFTNRPGALRRELRKQKETWSIGPG